NLVLLGSASGYHPLTFGFLVDCIIRRVDKKGRDLKTFFLEEIARPNGKLIISTDICGNVTS
ncbi:unnamed protein product, partial [Angiostrongylus costaricensis]|uniref:Adipocyte plasma membrane-associated protein n=1 Tax=Angiostrongylus costaricensis TaxID=334426 RepID=A0A0R3PET7_ANGCS